MKVETIPFPRQFTIGATGPDVRAVKRALKKAGGTGMADNGVFGARAGAELAEFKKKHKLLADPIYTEQAHEKLRKYFDAFGASLMAREAAILARIALRSSFVAARAWMVAHKKQFRYAQVRPIPEYLARFETKTTIYTDCSGSIELAAKWTPGCPDPSGLGFNGYGNTGSLLGHCKHITAKEALPGDLIVYRAGPGDTYGHHAVSIDRPEGNDFRVVSLGHQGDPNFYTQAAQHAGQSRLGYYDAVYLRFLPV